MMRQHLSSATNVTTFELQWRDWYYLTPMMRTGEMYEDILYQLQLVQRAPNPPTGTTLAAVTTVPLGTILSLYHNLRFGVHSRNIGNGAYNRFTTALNNVAATYPEITSYLNEATTHETDTENAQQDAGRKILRGRYNV